MTSTLRIGRPNGRICQTRSDLVSLGLALGDAR